MHQYKIVVLVIVYQSAVSGAVYTGDRISKGTDFFPAAVKYIADKYVNVGGGGVSVQRHDAMPCCVCVLCEGKAVLLYCYVRAVALLRVLCCIVFCLVL